MFKMLNCAEVIEPVELGSLTDAALRRIICVEEDAMQVKVPLFAPFVHPVTTKGTPLNALNAPLGFAHVYTAHPFGVAAATAEMLNVPDRAALYTHA